MKVGIVLDDLREIERGLKLIAEKVLQEDRRCFELWSEYFTALQMKERHPDWEVRITGAIGSPDVVCIKNDEKIRIQVKTGKWQRYPFGSDVVYSADASFGKGTQIKKKRFDYLVFIIHDYIEIREILILSIDQLHEVDARPIHNSKNPFFISKRESVEIGEKWRQFYNAEPVYEIEVDIIEHPEKYVDRWDKIK